MGRKTNEDHVNNELLGLFSFQTIIVRRSLRRADSKIVAFNVKDICVHHIYISGIKDPQLHTRALHLGLAKRERIRFN